MATADCRNGFQHNYDEDADDMLGDPLAVADTEHSDAARAEADSRDHQADRGGRVSRRLRHYHRIAEVRRLQGVTLRNVSRRLGLPLAVVRRQEESDCDLRLSDLLKWQTVLEVPVAELLVEDEGQLSGPVLQRSRMVKLMKTAAAIRERTEGTTAGRMVSMLIDQILELMPELADVTPWHSVGPRRTLGDVGRTARCTVSEDVFRSPLRD
jgi:transcriptional regulator with XRE-family HTH domain